jgi:hypothetical protein
VGKDEESTDLGRIANGQDEDTIFVTESGAAEDKPEDQPEQEEEDENTKRVFVAINLAKSGGFNPFPGDLPVRKPSDGSLRERRTSLETPESFGSTVREEQDPAAQPLARKGVDSLYETGFLVTETKEEVKPFDAFKRVEGDS